MEEDRVVTLEIWKQVLDQLLGWTETQVLAWASQHEDGLTGRDPEFYRESPCYYVAPLLIPDEVRASLPHPGTALIKLESEIQAAIEVAGQAPLFIEDYDWRAARQRIASILAGAERLTSR